MKASQIVDSLRNVYTGNRTQFDFSVNQHLNGDHNKTLRQEVLKIATGEKKPLTQCTPGAVSTALQAKFDQPELF